MARQTPSGANAIVLINVDQIMRSQVAIREGWRENLGKAQDAGLTMIPAQSSRVLSVAQIDLENMEPVWQAALADLNQPPSMAAVARQNAGREDVVDKLPAVVLPSNAYVVQLAPQTAGVMFPANRQQVTRWVREAKTATRAPLTPYLAEAVGYADKVGTDIVLAVDLADMLPEAYLRERIKANEVLSKRDVDVDALAKVLSNIQGVTLGILMRTGAYGKLKVDFRTDASIMAGYAQLLLLDVLGNNGVMIDDFRDWKAQVKGTQISIEGNLTKPGLRQVLSVFEPPAVVVSGETADKKADDPKSKPENQEAYASQQYFQSVSRGR